MAQEFDVEYRLCKSAVKPVGVACTFAFAKFSLFSKPKMERRNETLSPQYVAQLIDDGQIIVIYEGDALRLDSWLRKHPGGVLPIRHMVGRDATSEINA